jgi:perosamine synthetase
MTNSKLERAGNANRSRRTIGLRLPRRIAMLGGTTTIGDCVTALRHLIDPRQRVHGSAIEQYESAFARKVGVRYAFSFASGRIGLYGLLRSLGVKDGDEVLLQVPTHVVVPNAIRYAGAKPVYVDCRLDNYNMDLEQAEQKITSRTKVLLLQHTFGVPVDMDTALALARRHDLEVVEDCVHALGATYDEKQVGSLGRAAFFSTEETKIISSTMGGVAVTDDPVLAARLQAFQEGCVWPTSRLTAAYLAKFIVYFLFTEPHLHYFIRTLYELVGRRHPLPRATLPEELRGVRPAGYEQRLSNAQAALALRQLARLEDNLAHRRKAAQSYHTQLSQGGFDLLEPPAKAESAFVRYPVWVEDRGAIIREVAPLAVLGDWFTSVFEEGVGSAYDDYEMGSCPRAEAAAQHLINLPTHPRATPYDVKLISKAVIEANSVTRAST